MHDSDRTFTGEATGLTSWARGAHPRQHGVAMLLVLIAVAMATILSMSFLSSQSTSLGVAQNVLKHAQARSVAESALVVGINYVQTDPTWRADKTHGQWVTNASFNGGTFDLFGYDGLDTDGDGVVDNTDSDLADDTSDPVTLTVVANFNGVSHTVHAVVTPGGAAVSVDVLMIVGNPASLTTQDQDKIDLLNGWGFGVTLINDNDSQAEYDAAMADADVVYVVTSVSPSTVGSKLNSTSLGVVSDKDNLNDELLMTDTNGGSYTGSQIDIIDNTHYITSTVATADMNNLTITTSSQQLSRHRGVLAGGATVLATRSTNANPALVLVDVGDVLIGGSPSPNRRVLLPWGTTGIDITTLNTAGQTILKRSLEWAGVDVVQTSGAGIAVSGSISVEDSGSIDSFDSRLGAYGGSNVGSNAVLATNLTTGGAITVESGGTVGGSVMVGLGGDTATAISNAGSISGSSTVLTSTIAVPSITAPTGMPSSQGTVVLSGGTTNFGSDQRFSSLRIRSGATVQISGDVTLLVDGDFAIEDTSVLSILPGGSLKLYLNGGKYEAMGTAQVNVNTADPARMTIYQMASDHVDFEDSSQTYATVIAPTGLLHVKDSSHFYGTFQGDRAEIKENAQYHQDLAGIAATTTSDNPQLIALYEFQEVLIPPTLVGHWLLDEAGGDAPNKVYWYNNDADKLQQADLDGSNVQDLATGFETKYLTIDASAGKLYWFNKDSDKIQSSDLDGSNIQDLTTVVDVKALGLDPTGGKIFWSEKDPFQIMRANLDGTGAQMIASGFEAKQMIVDHAGGKLYWYNKDANKIQRSDLNGTNVQDVASGLGAGSTLDVKVMDLDLTAGKIYWSQKDPFQVMRADLDGANAEMIASGFEAKEMTLDVAGGKLYWYNKDDDKLQRSNLDGSNIEDLATGVEIKALALDPTGGKVYWSDKLSLQVTRANLDGSGAQVIASGFEAKELILNGGGLVATDDAAGNNGSSFGGATGGAAGNGDGGTAVQFDGVDCYIVISHDDAYLLDDGSVSFWFKPDNLSGHHGLFSKDSQNFDTGGHLHIYTDGKKLKVRLQSDGADYTLQSSGLSVGNWYHVVVSFGPGGLRLYRNGSQKDSDSYTGGLGTNSGGAGNYEPIVLGANTWSSDDLLATPVQDFFEGLIDDVRIYDQGFDVTQVNNIYTGNAPGGGVALIAYDTSGFGVPLDLDIEDAGIVSWVSGGGLDITAATRVISPAAATKLYDALTATNEVSLEVAFTPADTSQGGPARIVSYSGGAASRNITFGQEADAYVSRLRTDTTTSNGTPDISSSSVLTAATQEHVIVSYDGANVTMFRNGSSEVTSARTGTLNWDNTFRFMLGDEETGGLDWLGTLHRVAVYDRAFNANQASNVFGGSPPGDGTSGVGGVDWVEP